MTNEIWYRVYFIILQGKTKRGYILTKVSNYIRKKLGGAPFLIRYVITLSILTKLDISFIILIV